jgi:hypothetical protein
MPGVPDIIAFCNGGAFALEIKRPGGCVSPQQRACFEALEAAGVTTAVAYSLDEALATLEAWSLLRGCAALPMRLTNNSKPAAGQENARRELQARRRAKGNKSNVQSNVQRR